MAQEGSLKGTPLVIFALVGWLNEVFRYSVMEVHLLDLCWMKGPSELVSPGWIGGVEGRPWAALTVV